MKKKLKKPLARSLIFFAAIQLIMLCTSVFFAGGGHGTGIPLVIFYGPLLIFFQFKIFENTTLSFLVLFLILFGFFFAVWLGFISRKVLLYVASSYILISIGILIYIDLNHLGGLGSSSLSSSVKLTSALVAYLISIAFWKIIFDLAKIQQIDQTNTRIQRQRKYHRS